MTVRHLLNHSSGLASPIPIRWVYPDGSPPPDGQAFTEQLLLRKHRRLRFAPGAKPRYSNLGFLVFGMVIEAVSAMPYKQNLRHEVLGPLRMSHTGFDHAATGSGPPATGTSQCQSFFVPLLRAALPNGSWPASLADTLPTNRSTLPEPRTAGWWERLRTPQGWHSFTSTMESPARCASCRPRPPGRCEISVLAGFASTQRQPAPATSSTLETEAACSRSCACTRIRAEASSRWRTRLVTTMR